MCTQIKKYIMRRNICKKAVKVILLVTSLVLLHSTLKHMSDIDDLYEHINKIENNVEILQDTEDNHSNNDSPLEQEFEENISGVNNKYIRSRQSELKYILQWTSAKSVPFIYMGVGQQGFIERNCPYTNCVVTSNRKYLGDHKKFDVIVFSGPELKRLPTSSLPKARSPNQKFVFSSIESSHYYPVCSSVYDGFFNWTWTFRLDSISRWGYIIVRDAENNIIGPNKIMHWIKLEDMDPVSPEFKEELKTKTKAAAWFVSNCVSKSRRETFAKDLNNELKQYNLTVDIFGKCGPLSCPRNKEDECGDMLKRDYYFYLSFENSFSEDYATEKMLYGLQNSAIPIVFGEANYTRFMPDGIYLNARELGAKALAKKMYELINDPDSYAEYFRWRNHYSFHRRAESIETDDYCGFCKLLNNDELMRKTTVIEKFREWWNQPNFC